MKYWILIELLFLVVSSAQAATCPDGKTSSLISTKLDKNLKSVSKSFNEVAPFNFACQQPHALDGRPETGLFTRSLPMQDSQGRFSRTFFERIIAKIRAKIAANKNMSANLNYCLNSKEAKCAELNSWSENALPSYVKDARYHLSLGQSQHQLLTLAGEVSKKPNRSLDPLGSPKMKPWDALKPSEAKAAEQRIEFYRKEITKKFPDQSFSEKKESLLAYRYGHYETYRNMMSELPLLQYIHSESPSKSEILGGVKELDSNLLKEEQMTNELAVAVTKSPMPPKVLDLLNYTAFVEDVLLESPEYCGLASSLTNTRQNRFLGNAIGLALPILAVSMLAPPAAIALGGSAALGTGIAVGIGLSTGTVFAYQSHLNMKDQQARSFSQLYGDIGADGKPDPSALEQARAAEKSRNIQIITVPLAFGGLGAFNKVGITVGGMASKLNILQRTATLPLP